MHSASSFETRRGAITIPITVHVGLTDGCGGERWNVCSAIDERTAQGIGDIGVCEFDAHSDFPETIVEAVVRTLQESDLIQPGVFYSVEVSIMDGGAKIGWATRYFRGQPLISKPQG